MSHDTWLFIMANVIPVCLMAPVFLLLWLDKRQRMKDKASAKAVA